MDDRQKMAPEKAFNISPVVLALAGIYALVYLFLNFGFHEDAYISAFAHLAFNPGLYTLNFQEFWFSIFTYSFVYVNFIVFAINMAWFIVLGSPLANRLGVTRFIAFWILTPSLSALMIYVFASQSLSFVLGGYSLVGGMIGAGCCYNFQRIKLPSGQTEFKGPVLPFMQVLRSPLALGLMGFWLVYNLLFMMLTTEPDPMIAGDLSENNEKSMSSGRLDWQICMVGLFVGFFIVRFIDRRREKDKQTEE